MLTKKNGISPTPFSISALRFIHGCLACYAVAIIFLAGPHDAQLPWFMPERVLGIFIAMPLFLASAFSFFSAVLRSLFGSAIFFCTFAGLTLIALPAMTTFLFPIHIVVFAFAGVYIASAIVLARFFFEQPVLKKR